jgi:hypothetical protein
MIIFSLDASKLVAMSSCIEDRNGGFKEIQNQKIEKLSSNYR